MKRSQFAVHRSLGYADAHLSLGLALVRSGESADSKTYTARR